MLVAVSMDNNQIFIVQENICIMYYEIEMWLILHSAVNFRQNRHVCRKWICKAKFHMYQRLRPQAYTESETHKVRTKNFCSYK